MLVFSFGEGCRKLHNFRSLGQITPNFDKLRYLQANGEERKRKKILKYNKFNEVKSIYSFYLAAYFNKLNFNVQIKQLSNTILVSFLLRCFNFVPFTYDFPPWFLGFL